MTPNEITKIIKEVVNQCVFELKKQNLLKDNNRTPYQKTEYVLYNYSNFVSAVISKEDDIKDIEEYGIKQKSKSITSYGGNTGGYIMDEYEKKEQKIDEINHSIQITKKFIDLIDRAFEEISDDYYYDVVIKYYFDGLSYENIANDFECDISTIGRNKKRLVTKLSIILFSDETVNQLFA